MEKENIITQYIAVWGWHILGINFLISSFLMIAIARETLTSVLAFAFLISFMICEAMSYRRKMRLIDYE